MQSPLYYKQKNDMWEKIKSLFNSHNNMVHQIKNDYTSEMLRIDAAAIQQQQHSKEVLKIVKSSRAYKIAVATGGKKRGL